MLFNILSVNATCLVDVLEPKIAVTATEPPEPLALNVDGLLVVLLRLVVFELFQ